MKFFDYVWCLMFADFISSGIVNMNPWIGLFGLSGYILYEAVRKEMRST